jgi:hypothetical protein
MLPSSAETSCDSNDDRRPGRLRRIWRDFLEKLYFRLGHCKSSLGIVSGRSARWHGVLHELGQLLTRPCQISIGFQSAGRTTVGSTRSNAKIRLWTSRISLTLVVNHSICCGMHETLMATRNPVSELSKQNSLRFILKGYQRLAGGRQLAHHR